MADRTLPSGSESISLAVDRHKGATVTGRCLIIANQTLGGSALDREVRDCIRGDISEFYVVVPMTPVEHESTAWNGGFALGDTRSSELARAALEENARRFEADLAEAQRRVQRRLDLMIEKIESAGGEADGEIGSADPVEAARVVLERDPAFDEIIVSTLPGGLSRWLKMDLPSRIDRMTDVPVITIEAEA